MIDKNKIIDLNLDSRLEKILLLLHRILAYAPLLVFFYIVYTFIYPQNFDKKNRDDFTQTEFTGIVIKRYIDHRNHATPTIVLSNYSKREINSKLFSKISIGDSVAKKKGKSTVQIYKSDGKLVVFNYLKDNKNLY